MRNWIISGEISHGNDTGSYPCRMVISAVHPISWVTTYEKRYRCTVKLFFWEEITPQFARTMKDFRDEND